MPLKRRHLLTGSAALLSGCAGYQGGNGRYSFLTPGVLANTLQQEYNTTYGFQISKALNDKRLVNFDALNKWRLPDNPLPPLLPDAQRVQGLNAILDAPWQIKLGAHNILGFKHLYAVAHCGGLGVEFLRIDGIAVDPEPFNKQTAFLNPQTLSFGGSMLMGVFSDPRKPAVGYDKGDGTGERLTVATLNYRQMLGFIADVSQFALKFDLELRPYQLLSTNSNAFLATALENSLPGIFNRPQVAKMVQARSWDAPGFNVVLDAVPGFVAQFASRLPDSAMASTNSIIKAASIDPVDAATGSVTQRLIAPFYEIEAVRNMLIYIAAAAAREQQTPRRRMVSGTLALLNPAAP